MPRIASDMHPSDAIALIILVALFLLILDAWIRMKDKAYPAKTTRRQVSPQQPAEELTYELPSSIEPDCCPNLPAPFDASDEADFCRRAEAYAWNYREGVTAAYPDREAMQRHANIAAKAHLN